MKTTLGEVRSLVRAAIVESQSFDPEVLLQQALETGDRDAYLVFLDALEERDAAARAQLEGRQTLEGVLEHLKNLFPNVVKPGRGMKMCLSGSDALVEKSSPNMPFSYSIATRAFPFDLRFLGHGCPTVVYPPVNVYPSDVTSEAGKVDLNATVEVGDRSIHSIRCRPANRARGQLFVLPSVEDPVSGQWSNTVNVDHPLYEELKGHLDEYVRRARSDVARLSALLGAVSPVQ